MTDLDTLTDAWDRLTPGPVPVDAILRAHHTQQHVRRRRVLAAVGAAAAVAVVAASLAVQAQRTTPAPEPGLPATSAPTPEPAPTTASSTTVPDPTATVFVLVNGSGLRFVGLMPRTVPSSAAGEPAETALRALFVYAPRRRGFLGPENAWLDRDGRALAGLRSVDRGDGQVVVDLATADATLDWDPDYEEVLPLLQVVCTAQAALGTTDPVRITLRGEPVRLFGRDASRPRTCPTDVLPRR